MLSLLLPRSAAPLRVLCIGAHSDDIEIGCGGTVLDLLKADRAVALHWAVASASTHRVAETQASITEFRARANPESALSVSFGGLREGVIGVHLEEARTWLFGIRDTFAPDVIFVHYWADLHQDHRALGELALQIFRDQLIVHYEIPKYDGDLGTPTVYMPLSAGTAERKVAILVRSFPSQSDKDWFDARTFEGLMRIRGIECRAPSGFAEAFHVRKLVLNVAE